MKHAVNDSMDSPTLKKQRTGPTPKRLMRHRQPGMRLALAHSQNSDVFDKQLDRGLSVALHLAGFDGVKVEAFEGLRGAVHQYMSQFSLCVARSMHAARRRKPQSRDFEQALRAFDMRLDSYYEDLKIAAPLKVTQPTLVHDDPAASEHFDFTTESTVFGVNAPRAPSAKGLRQSWVPKHMPTFPPVHTYKMTAVMPKRLTDARRVREQATEEGILAERALRKLVAARKPSRQRAQERAQGDLYRTNEEAFRDTMRAVLAEDSGAAGLLKEDQMLLLDGAGDLPPAAPDPVVDEDLGMTAIVNWDQAHWRQKAARDILGAT